VYLDDIKRYMSADRDYAFRMTQKVVQNDIISYDLINFLKLSSF